ncbi:hypothetical protein [Methylobacterium sp. UNC300MFChir4.1]|uniref:hypothetical protein n=1 Tax=Methylobacterium sp. UNC300MFChir4.1 TaxID=1502747 RepID=UPI001113AB8C|nr:hypothetical protein [Methylobacterium sp. UNC300MFChir4.1]
MTDDAKSAPKKRMGRPPKPASEVKRHGVAFRVNDKLREQIQQSAEQNQRSIAEEVEYRLQLSATVIPLIEEMASDKATQELFRTISKTIRAVRNVSKRANLNEIETRAAIKSAFDYISGITFWTGDDLPPPPEGYIGKMSEPPKNIYEKPPAAIGYSIASDVMLSDSIWEECRAMEDFGEVIVDYWSGDGTTSIDASSPTPLDRPARSLEDIMDEVNPRDRARRTPKP